jgi:hypothetical protein
MAKKSIWILVKLYLNNKIHKKWNKNKYLLRAGRVPTSVIARFWPFLSLCTPFLVSDKQKTVLDITNTELLKNIYKGNTTYLFVPVFQLHVGLASAYSCLFDEQFLFL